MGGVHDRPRILTDPDDRWGRRPHWLLVDPVSHAVTLSSYRRAWLG